MRLPRWFAERVEPTAPDAELRVSTIELFFDLVFVFTIMRLTSSMADDFTWHGGAGGIVAATVPIGLWSSAARLGAPVVLVVAMPGLESAG